MLVRSFCIPVILLSVCLAGLVDLSQAAETDRPALSKLSEEGQEAAAESRELVKEALGDDFVGHSTTPESAAHGGAHGEANSDPLEFKADLAIWTAVVFLVVLAILKKFAWGPIAKGLDSREEGIAEQIAEAKLSNEDAKKLLKQYESKLDSAGGEVRQMLAEARKDAKVVGQKIVDAANGDAESKKLSAIAEIETATNVALGELAGRSADLAVDLAGKIVSAELKKEDHTNLVNQAVEGFARQAPK
jgi:F-type H+-transporting ATPase subunit b